MQSKRNISGTILAIILVLLHFFGLIGLMMSVPVGSVDAIKLGARLSMTSLLYGFIQTFYILLRPSFSAPCSDTRRMVKTGGFLVSSVVAGLNLLVGGLLVYGGRRGYGEEDEVVQASAASVALFHGGLFWAYTRMPVVFLPFTTANAASTS